MRELVSLVALFLYYLSNQDTIHQRSVSIARATASVEALPHGWPRAALPIVSAAGLLAAVLALVQFAVGIARYGLPADNLDLFALAGTGLAWATVRLVALLLSAIWSLVPKPPRA